MQLYCKFQNITQKLENLNLVIFPAKAKKIILENNYEDSKLSLEKSKQGTIIIIIFLEFFLS